MSVAAVRRVVSRLEPTHPLTDAELVAAIVPACAEREAAFAELVARHGPMVLGVCRRVLSDAHDAEDAFQAVFLVLARKSKSIRPPGAVGGWLHGVAVRTARKAKTAAARRRRREMIATAKGKQLQATEGDADRAELRAVIDAELAAIPEMQRAAVVLCDLNGKTRAEAAAELGRPEGTVAAWLARGRKALAQRLARRGIALPAAGLVAIAGPATVSAELASLTIATFLGRAAPSAVLALAEGVVRGLTSSGTKLASLALACSALLAVVATAGGWHSGDEQKPDAPRAPAPIAAPVPQPEPDVKAFLDHRGYVYSVSCAPDGKKFLSVGNGTAAVWDSATLKKLFTVDAEFAAFSGDGKSLFALVKDEFRTHDAVSGKQLGKKPRQMPKAVHPGRTAAFAREAWMWIEFDGVRHHLRTEIADELYDLTDQFNRAHTGGLRNVNHGRGGAFGPDDKQFAGIHRMLRDAQGGPQGSQGVLSIWNPTNGTRIGTIVRDANHPVHSFAWSPDGKEIAVGYSDGVRVYDAATLKESRVLDPPGRWGDPRPFTTALAWSKDGKTLAAAITTDVPKVENLDDGRTIIKLDAIRISVRLLDAQSGKEMRRVEGFSDNLPVVSLAFAPDGKHLLSGAGFFPGDGPASNVPQPAKDANGLRVIPISVPPKPDENPGPVAWKETKVLELPGWLAGSVAYSPDGKTLFVGGTSGFVRAYDATTWKQLWEYQEKTNFAAVAVVPDGKQLVTTTKDGLRFLDAATGKEGDALEEKGSEPCAVGFFPDEIGTNTLVRKVIFGNARGYTVKTRREAAEVEPQVSTITTSTTTPGEKPADEHAVPIAVSPDGRRAVVTGPIDRDTGRNVLWAWSAGSGDANKILEGHKATVVSAAWSKNSKVIVTGDTDGVVITWDAATFKEKSRLSLGGRVAAVAVTDDGFGVAAAVVRSAPGTGTTTNVFTWLATIPPEKPQPLSSSPTQPPFLGVASLAFSPDGKQLVSCFANFTHLRLLGRLIGQVQVFAIAPVPQAPDPKPEAKFVPAVGYSPDGKRYFVLKGGTAHVHDSATGKELWSAPAEAARFTADGKSLVVMGPKAVRFLEAATGKETASHSLPKTKFAWHHVAFSPDGKRFAAHFGMQAAVYGTATGTEQVPLKSRFEMAGWVQGVMSEAVAFSPDGKKLVAVGVLVTQGGQRGAAVWDTETGNRLHTFAPDPRDELHAAAFSPDSELLALGFKDRVEVRYVGAGNVKKDPLMKLATDASVTALAYSKDGKQLAVGVRARSFDRWWADVREAHKGEVLLFDAETGQRLRRLAIPNDSVLVIDGKEVKIGPAERRGQDGVWLDPLATALGFSPDGKTLLAGTGFPAGHGAPPNLSKGAGTKLFDLNAAPEAPPAPARKWADAAVLTDHGRLVNGVAVARDGKSFAAATEGGVTCWDAITRKVLWTYKPVDMATFALAYSPDGKHLCVATKIDVTRLDAKTGKPDPWTDDNAIWFGKVKALAYHPSDNRLAASNGSKTVVCGLDAKGVEAVVAEKPVGEGADPLPLPAGVAWSNNDRLACIFPEKKGDVWPVGVWSDEGKLVLLRGHAEPVTCVTWSKDGKLIASGDEKGIVTAWDAATGKELWRKAFKGRDDTAGRVNALAFSPADNTLAVAVSLGSGKQAERVVLLEPKAGEDVEHLMRPWRIPVSSLGWAENGKFLVTGCSAADRGVEQTEPAVGEVVVWERE